MFRSSYHLVYFATQLYFFFYTITSSQYTGIADKPEDCEVVVGSIATFHCILNADHSLYLNIKWLIEGKPIDFKTNSRFVETDNRSLIITNTMASDSGTYTCLAISAIDNATASYRLITQNKPSPPQILETTCHDKRAMVIWRSKENNQPPILYFSIEYNTSFAPETWSVASRYIPSTAKTYLVPLTPWTDFTFRVIAINKIGRSNPSSLSKVCSTQPDVPYKNPEGVAVSESDHSCYLVVSWTPMPLVEHNGPDFVYRVCWKKDVPEESWNCEVVTDYTENELDIVYNGQKNQSYRVKVVASNIIGNSKGHQTEVIRFLGTYDKESNEILYTLKWIFTIFAAVYFFVIILFTISPMCLPYASNERAHNNKLMRTSGRRNNRSLLRFLGHPHSFWVSSIGAKKSEIEQNSNLGSTYSMVDINEHIEEVINEENSFCDLMQTNITE